MSVHAVSRPSDLSVTDLFCGAGGSSWGARKAGMTLRLGINHWPRAILTHSENFPDADHDCADVHATSPRRYFSTDILIASPECKEWTQANGKPRKHRGQMGLPGIAKPPKPEEERSRATMWNVIDFAQTHDYRAVVVENVVEAWSSPLMGAWFHAWEALGYRWRALWFNSMVFPGVPSSRDRMYVVLWKAGNRAPELDYRPRCYCVHCEKDVEGNQVWRNPVRRFGRYGGRNQYIFSCSVCGREAVPYITPALSAIDLSIKGVRIGDRKKPLVPATRARIQYGIDNFWGDEPLVIHFRGTSPGQLAGSARQVDQPLGTITGGGLHHGVLERVPLMPLYVKNYGSADKAGPMAHPVDEPLGSLTGRDSTALLMPPPLLIDYTRSTDDDSRERVRSVAEPMFTLTGTRTAALLRAPLVDTMRTNGRSRTIAEPLTTIVGGCISHSLIEAPDAFVTVQRRTGNPTHVIEPMPTLAGKMQHELVSRPTGERPAIEDCYFRMFSGREVGLGMAFPDQTEYPVGGTLEEVIQQYGQAVTPPVMEWVLGQVADSLR